MRQEEKATSAAPRQVANLFPLQYKILDKWIGALLAIALAAIEPPLGSAASAVRLCRKAS